MSIPANYEKRFSSKTVTKWIKKYGMTIEVIQRVETRPEWSLIFRHPETKEVISKEEAAQRVKDKVQVSIDWEVTDSDITMPVTEKAFFRDEELPNARRCVELYSITDGPVLGIRNAAYDDGSYILLDPCFLQLDRQQRLKYLPIFGVERELVLAPGSVKSIVAPPEALLEGYLGFVIQNRMCKYQLRPVVPFSETAPLESASDAYDPGEHVTGKSEF